MKKILNHIKTDKMSAVMHCIIDIFKN